MANDLGPGPGCNFENSFRAPAELDLLLPSLCGQRARARAQRQRRGRHQVQRGRDRSGQPAAAGVGRGLALHEVGSQSAPREKF